MSNEVYTLSDALGVITGISWVPSGQKPGGLLEGQQIGPVLEPSHPAVLAPNNYRVVDEQVIERLVMTPLISQTNIVANGIAECVITGLPDPCLVEIFGAMRVPKFELSGGTLTLTSTQPGAIQVAVRADPTHKLWETTIHAA
jgi:hypothetical protein